MVTNPGIPCRVKQPTNMPPQGGRPEGEHVAPDSSTLCVLVDIFFIVVSFALCAYFLFGNLGVEMRDHPERALFISLVYSVLEILFLFGFEMYSIVLDKPYVTTITLILSSIYTFTLTLFLKWLLFRNLDGLVFLVFGCALSFVLLSVWRSLRYSYHEHSHHRQKILMIEKEKQENTRVRRMKYACMSRFDAWYEHVDINNMEEVKSFIEEMFPRFDVICLMESVPLPVRDVFMSEALHREKDIYIVPAMYEMSFSKVKLALFDDVMVFHLMPYRMSMAQAFFKRAMDIVFSGMGLLVAAIPMVIVALLIKCTSPGPVFYKQLRLTKGKKEFYIYKFRSMVQDAEKATGPMMAQKNDARVTKVGKYLRAMRLDELPQLINILKGDMSIVGPRPERPFFVEKNAKEVENYDKRFLVRAGLTALSHVYGRYSTDVIDRTRYDLLYIQNYSLALDIKVMLLTSRTIFLKDAAEGLSDPPQSDWRGDAQSHDGGK